MKECPVCLTEKDSHVHAFHCEHTLCFECNSQLKHHSVANFKDMICPMCRAPEYREYSLFPYRMIINSFCLEHMEENERQELNNTIMGLLSEFLEGGN